MVNYRKRVADSILAEKLSYMGAVLICGAKWCGKTTTAEQLAKSVLYLSEPSSLENNLELARLRPQLLLEGAKPRLIDEWQEAPTLWDAVRFAVDHEKGMGQFILTGSAVPKNLEAIHHTGTGRIAHVTMRTMTLWESGESTGSVSLAKLFGGADVTGAKAELHLEDLARLVCRGGWPQAIDLKGRAQFGPAREYVEAICAEDLSRVDGVVRSAARVRALLRSLARVQGTQASAATICEDIRANEPDTLNANTVYSYLDSLERIFVCENLPAWSPKLRSKTPIRSGVTRYFTDPSIAAAALRLGPNDLMGDLPTFGFFFEALAIRDLRTYAEALDGELFHYLDKGGLECDAVMHLHNGEYALVEVKLGGAALIEKGAANLRELAGKIDGKRMKAPRFLMVLVGEGDFAYRREDGVVVCPIGCLRP
jgi:uncharacterized protein